MAANAEEKNNDNFDKHLDEWYKVASEAAYAAGELIKKFINDSEAKSVNTKLNHTDLVTAIDKKCEDCIIGLISKAYPDHKFIAEESTEDNTRFDITDAPTWFVDPIDGTTNFFHGFHYTAVSIGLRVNKKAVVGIVHCPLINETYTAIIGRGAFLQSLDTRKKLSVSDTTELSKALIITEFGYDRTATGNQATLSRLNKLLVNKVRGIRCLGCCSFNMCQIASGRADICYEGRNSTHGPKPWDFTAAEVILNETGAVLMLPEGKPWDCTKGRLLCCANKTLADAFVKLQMYDVSQL